MIRTGTSLPYEAIRERVDHPHDCLHPESEIRNKPDSKGNPRYHRQCLRCGQSVEGRIAKARIDTLKPVLLWDDELETRVWAKFREDWEQARKTIDSQADGDWWRKYNEYLKSPKWTKIRQSVLQRDQFLCQGCLTARANQVHHLTYEHVMEEFLFELIAVCDDCHRRLHPEPH